MAFGKTYPMDAVDDSDAEKKDAPSKPPRWERFYTNIIVLGTLFAFACALFSYGVGSNDAALTVAGATVGIESLGEALQKAAFIVMTIMGPGYLLMVGNMARQTLRVDGRALPNPTAWVMALLAIVMIGVTLVSIDVAIFVDSAFEGVAGGIGGSMLAVLYAFAGDGDAD